MKKLGLLVSGIVLSTALMAQKPESGAPSTLEGLIGWNASTLSFNAPSLRYRYFLQDNIAVRVTLGINNTSTTDNFFENEDNNTGGTGTYETRNNGLTFGFGGEYHFAGTNRLSPYVGADILFGSGKVSTDGQNADGVGFVDDYSEMSEYKTSMFGVNLVAGTDFYFAQNFYFGLELGLGWMSNKQKEGQTTVTFGGNTFMSKSNEATTSDFGNNVISTFRLGWRF
jgi:outer membrane protein W